MAQWTRLDVDFEDIGPVSRTYLKQLEANRAQARYERLRADLFSEFGTQTPPLGSSTIEWIENHPDLRKAREALETAQQIAREHQEQIGGIAYCVATDNLSRLEKKLAALNRKAAKLDTEPISLNQSDERTVFEYTYAQDYDRGYSAKFEHVYCVLKGGTPKIEGFDFIATIQHTDAGNILRTIPQIRQETQGLDVESLDLSPYRDTGPFCEHCNKIRSRKDTYLIFNRETGELKQIGRTCLRDYTGLNNPEKVADWLEFYWELEGKLSGSRGETPIIPIEDYLTHVALKIREHGFRSRGQYGHGSSTADWAIRNYWDMLGDERDKETGKPLYTVPEDQDVERAKLVRQWVLNDWSENSDFALNVKTALANEALQEKSEGIAAAAFSARDRVLARAEKQHQRQQEQAAQEFVGKIKERREFTLTLHQIRWVENHYSFDGMKPLYIFSDEEGNTIKWFASNTAYNEHDAAIIEDGTYRVKATVTKHEDNERYGKATMVSRAKILSTVSEP